MFDIYNEARRLNEILAEHKFGPRWVTMPFSLEYGVTPKGKETQPAVSWLMSTLRVVKTTTDSQKRIILSCVLR